MGIMGRLCAFLFSFFCFSAMPWKQTPLIKSQAQRRRGQIRSHTCKKKKNIKTHSLVSGKLHIEAARRWRCVIVGQTAHLAHSNQSHVLTRLMAKNVARRIKRRPGLKVAFVSSRGGASVKAGRTRTHKVKMELRLARVAAKMVAKKV